MKRFPLSPAPVELRSAAVETGSSLLFMTDPLLDRRGEQIIFCEFSPERLLFSAVSGILITDEGVNWVLSLVRSPFITISSFFMFWSEIATAFLLLTFSGECDTLLSAESDWELSNGNCSLLTFNQSSTLLLFLLMCRILLVFSKFYTFFRPWAVATLITFTLEDFLRFPHFPYWLFWWNGIYCYR